MYAEGDLPLSGVLVSDAIERFLNRSLNLDPSIAVPLVQRYIADVAKARKAGADVGYAARHTPKALLGRIKEVMGVTPDPAETDETDEKGRPLPGRPPGNTAKDLDQVLSQAVDLLERSRDVVLAPSFDESVSLSTVESLDLADENGDHLPMLESVTRAVAAAVSRGGGGQPDPGRRSWPSTSPTTRSGSASLTCGRAAASRRHTRCRTARIPRRSRSRRGWCRPLQHPRWRVPLAHLTQAGIIIQRYRYGDPPLRVVQRLLLGGARLRRSAMATATARSVH